MKEKGKLDTTNGGENRGLLKKTSINMNDNDNDSVSSESRTRKLSQSSTGLVNLALNDGAWTFTPPGSPHTIAMQRGGAVTIQPGRSRYLKGSEVDDVQYDFAIVTRRETPKKNTSYDSGGDTSPHRDDYHRIILDKLTENGLDVDVLEGDFTTEVDSGRSNRPLRKSKYFILLVRGEGTVLTAYGRRLKFQTWLRSGNTREVESLTRPQTYKTMTPSDRIQVVDHIIREEAQLSEKDPNIHAIFPVHDEEMNKTILSRFFQSFKLENQTESFVSMMRSHFGEKVTYYFAYMDWYNKSLVPISILGVALTISRPWLGMVMYMRILVVWAILVSIIWSFWFLKSWSRRNSELNAAWENNLETKGIVYRNPNFRGIPFTNPVTGQIDQYYPKWKRYPTYFVMVLFMVLQIAIMMLMIACWITVFEVVLVRYPDSGIFTAQWFYILGGGICYGLFVDIFQWKLIVSKAADIFTEWENWKTVEQFEKSKIRKLFLMDFLNYYTWFFLLAFVYVLPGVGDAITNFLNSMIWEDPPNCCFGPYLSSNGRYCNTCPPSWKGAISGGGRCRPCRGWVTFDINHLDLEKLFLTPIIVTQGLNLVLAVLIPWLARKHRRNSLQMNDRIALTLAKARGPRQLIADMTYYNYSQDDIVLAELSNKSKSRYLENTDQDLEKLTLLAGNILFQSEQEDYDPYDDYHHAIVQFGFVVMFSMLWPLMPMACMIINALKTRGDGFRLCKTLKRPCPRKAGGIGEWHNLLQILACIGVIVNIGLIFISTGAVEFYDSECSQAITYDLGDDWSNFRFGPDFTCFSLTTRMIFILVSEHIAFSLIWLFWRLRPSVPASLELEMIRQEIRFKSKVYKREMKKHDRIERNASSFENISQRHLQRGGSRRSTLMKQISKGRDVSGVPGTPTMMASSLSPNPMAPMAMRIPEEMDWRGEREPLLMRNSVPQRGDWETNKSESCISDTNV